MVSLTDDGAWSGALAFTWRRGPWQVNTNLQNIYGAGEWFEENVFTWQASVGYRLADLVVVVPGYRFVGPDKSAFLNVRILATRTNWLQLRYELEGNRLQVQFFAQWDGLFSGK